MRVGVCAEEARAEVNRQTTASGRKVFMGTPGLGVLRNLHADAPSVDACWKMRKPYAARAFKNLAPAHPLKQTPRVSQEPSCKGFHVSPGFSQWQDEGPPRRGAAGVDH